ILGIIFVRPVARFLGADDAMIDHCVIYARIILAALPAFMLQNMFQSFLITAEKPTMGLIVTVAAGVTNMFLDGLFIAVFNWGLAGAAMATAMSQCVGGIVPLLYFCRENSSLLRLTETRFYGNVLWHSCSNGVSELLSNVSMSIVSMLYNFQLMRVAGENGIAAYGVIMYVQFIFIAIFIGYSIGTAPIISFNYGAGNHVELQNLFKKSAVVIIGTSVVLTATALLLSGILSGLFVGYDESLCDMTTRGFQLCSIAFLFCGIGIFGSSLFTALNNGIVSAVISFLRSVVFQVAAVIVLPIFFGLDGIWASVMLAELAGMLITLFFVVKLKDRYHYM
ncbi:MAG: MATE family efflux transporter, partial [Peptococcaceae bacterium]|nr:MATE family efflux transporter [Peptococcaceae bacterium]